jgi:protein TonB
MNNNKYAPKDYERKATQQFLTTVLAIVLLGGLVFYLFMPTESIETIADAPEEETILAFNDEKVADPAPFEEVKEQIKRPEEKETVKEVVVKKAEPKESIKKEPVRKENTKKSTSIDETEALILVDEMATPKSGFEAYYRYIRENMPYPAEAIKQGIEGKVTVAFIVDKEGNLHNISIKKGLGHGCDEAAMRVVKEGEKWKPAKNKGELVMQKITLPISFKLGNNK